MNSKTIINKANNYLENLNHRQLLYEFLEKFSQCEVYARMELKGYLKKESSNIKEEEIVLNSRDIINSFSENGIYFKKKELITRIFGSNDRVGESSCRWLRNKITHLLMLRAIKEVCERNKELISDMNDFMNQIDNQSY